MTTKTSPLRRSAAVAAVLGAVSFGAVAVAPAALADESAASAGAVAGTSQQAAQQWIVSPLPDGPVPVELGQATVVLPPHAAQVLQTMQANYYAGQGYQVSFDEHGKLVIGPKICDPEVSADLQPGCVLLAGDAPRF